MSAHTAFPFGIEEEYYLVDLDTRDLAAEVPAPLFAAFKAALGTQFSTEYVRSQIEINTPVCHSMAQARRSLVQLRRTIGDLAAPHRLAPIAASTHPFARWRHQDHTDSPRYNSIADDLQSLGRRMVISGLHVHVGIDGDELRIDLMSGLRQFLPVLLALSTSSPFWQGENTGLKSFRTAVNDAVPRRGIPEDMASWGEFRRTVDVLVRAGVIEDASMIWWDLRPSVRFPTLEMRITDVCPLVDDGLCIAALFRCLCRRLYRIRHDKATLPVYPLLLVNENRWRAERYGMEEGFVDLDSGRIVPFRTVVNDLLELIREDAEFLGCVEEIEHARTIMERGTSADRQMARYQRLRQQGLPREGSLAGVVDLLIEETMADAAVPGTANASRKHRSFATIEN